MALAFSLSAALLAILVQQWVGDHMHVFQRYSDPLKSARIRQYLHEGSDGWYMPVVAESVPGLLHISLFLFFVGLGDFVMNINTAVGLSTTIPIGISGLMYIFTILRLSYTRSRHTKTHSRDLSGISSRRRNCLAGDSEIGMENRSLSAQT